MGSRRTDPGCRDLSEISLLDLAPVFLSSTMTRLKLETKLNMIKVEGDAGETSLVSALRDPSLIRCSPLLEWSYRDIWDFILASKASFLCQCVNALTHCFMHGLLHGLLHGVLHGVPHGLMPGFMHGLPHSVLNGLMPGFVHGLVHGFVHGLMHASMKEAHAQEAHAQANVFLVLHCHTWTRFL